MANDAMARYSGKSVADMIDKTDAANVALGIEARCRALVSVGSRIEMSSAIIPITTSNSTSVKAFRLFMMSLLLLMPKNEHRLFSLHLTVSKNASKPDI